MIFVSFGIVSAMILVLVYGTMRTGSRGYAAMPMFCIAGAELLLAVVEGMVASGIPPWGASLVPFSVACVSLVGGVYALPRDLALLEQRL